MGFQVPSPTHVSKSQHGGKVPTFQSQKTIQIWLIIIKDFTILCRNIHRTYVESWV